MIEDARRQYTTGSLESCVEEGGTKGKRLGLREKIRVVRQKNENLGHKYE
jgi:hypothetical protein